MLGNGLFVFGNGLHGLGNGPYLLGNGRICTDGNIVFRCDSDKNSLVIISMF